MTTFLMLPPAGSIYYSDPVATFASLPATDTIGTIRLVEDVGVLYYWTGAAWTIIAQLMSAGAASDTNSIDQTITSGVLTSDVRLSSNAAAANNQVVALNIESTGVVGLRAQIANSQIRGLFSGTAPVAVSAGGVVSMPVATSLANGYLSSADWSTFNGKEAAISSGTNAQFWRGDKSFQTLNVAAMTAEIAATAAATGAIGEILTASQASNTTSNVAASGSYGFATSLSLTAGVWQVQGVAGFNENSATLNTALECGISSSSTGGGISEFDTTLAPFLISSTSDALISTPIVYVNISSTTTYYLNTRFYYSAGTPRHRGKITALRIR